MSNTKIEWADAVWNPVTGCTPISEGCQNCYAKRIAKRLAGRCGYPADEPFRVTFHKDKLTEPLRWKKPRRIFVGSMTDLFHEDVDYMWLDQVLYMVYVCPQHTFIMLTKRPQRMRDALNWWYDNCTTQSAPLPNLWLCVTAENQLRADERIPILLEIPAAKHIVSYEPALEQVDFRQWLVKHPYYLAKCPGCGWVGTSELCGAGDYFTQDSCTCPKCGTKTDDVKGDPSLDWVICGGETGPGARPFNIDWARASRSQCWTAGVPFFFKTTGGKEKSPLLDGEIIREVPR